MALIALSLPRARESGRVFVLVGLALVAWALITRPEWTALTADALVSAGFVGGLFVALAWLRSAAATSERRPKPASTWRNSRRGGATWP